MSNAVVTTSILIFIGTLFVIWILFNIFRTYTCRECGTKVKWRHLGKLYKSEGTVCRTEYGTYDDYDVYKYCIYYKCPNCDKNIALKEYGSFPEELE